jgi:hypothetical protein
MSVQSPIAAARMAFLAALAGMFISCGTAHAALVLTYGWTAHYGIVFASGKIESNDAERLQAFVRDLERNRLSITDLSIDSPGGEVTQAAKIAKVVITKGLTVDVEAHHVCASACFIILAAAPRKAVWSTAAIGVHSLSIAGVENAETQADTLILARALATLGIPSGTIVRMLSAEPSETAWLSAEEVHQIPGAWVVDNPFALTGPLSRLLSPEAIAALPRGFVLEGAQRPLAELPPGFVLGRPPADSPTNTCVSYECQAAERRRNAPAPESRGPWTEFQRAQTPSVPALASAPPTGTGKSPAFQEGVADRRAWQTWLATLPGLYRAGAEWWAGQRSLPKPGSCFVPNLADTWRNGCLEAHRRLTPVDARRKAAPEFKQGWNSLAE